MLNTNLLSQPAHTQSGATRRDFLRAGAFGLTGLSLGGVTQAADQTRARSVILVFLGGGLSHIDSLDPKPEAAAEIRGKYRPISTVLPGVNLSEQLPRIAQVLDRVALVRSFTHDNNHHETASNWVLSGRQGSAFGDHPAIGAVVAHETQASSSVPPYVAVPRNPSFTWELGKSAYLGKRCESITPETASPLARTAFAIEQEKDAVRDRYGRTTTGESMLLARRLVEHGTRFVTVNCPGWDHHRDIFGNLDRKLPEFDTALSALIEDLDTRCLFADTLLVVMSEFGRTPKLNADAGRDHWGRAGSVLFAGGGVKRGYVLGETDRQGAFVTERPVTPADVAFTIYHALGIDPRKQLARTDGRPTAILDGGKPVTELFA